jgi:hypothetical protein
VYSSFHRFHFSAVARESPLRDYHAFDHPFPSIMMEIFDARPQQVDSLVEWLRVVDVPSRINEASPLCLAFQPERFAPPPAGFAVDRVGPLNATIRTDRVCLLWMGTGDPHRQFAAFSAGLKEPPDALGSRQFVAPFIRTLPGTNVYVDELRG